MIVRDNSAVLEKQHYKMYKSGKSWVIAGIATMALGGSMIATGTAHADEVPTAQSAQQTISQPQSSSTLQATNSSEASTQNSGASTSTIANQQSGQLTQPVTVDHSALDQATSNASQSGVLVHQTQTVTKVIPEGQKAQAVKDAENDYAQQAQTINRQVAEYNQQKDNQSKYNGARGDTTKLDDAVKEAQNTPGITVIQDKDQASTVSPTNESVKAFNEHATFNNNEQAKAIQDAIATQKQKVQVWKNQQFNNKDGILGNDIHQYFFLNAEPNAKMSVKQLVPSSGITGNDGNIFWYEPTVNTSGDLLEAIYTNLNNSFFVDSEGNTHKIAKIVRKFSALSKAVNKDSIWFMKHVVVEQWKNNQSWSDDASLLDINIDPSVGAQYFNSNSVTVQDTYYDIDGNQIDPTGGFYVISSLNHNNSGNDIENVSGTGVIAKPIVGSTVSVQSDGSLMASNSNDVIPGGATGTSKDWDEAGGLNFYYGAGLMEIKSSSPTLTFKNVADGSNSNNSFWFTINTQVPYAPIRSEVHYHYNTAAVQAPSHADATYHLYDLEVPNVQPTKSETDDNGVDINGEALMAGDRVNFGLGWVLTPYKDIDANSDSIHKGFQYVDDYQDDALVPDIDKATITDTVTGQAVTGITLTKWDSLNSAPQTIKDIVAKAGVHPTGAFLLWSANDPESFYKNYVVTGHDLKINLPMTVKTDFSGKLKNQAVQIDFGTGHSTNEVGNEVHKLDPHKDVVVNVGSKQSLNNQDVSLGQVADYELDSSIRPANYGGQTDEWSFTDHVDTVHDQLTGNNKVFAKTSMVLNGHQYNAGDDISSYFDIKQQDGTVTFTAKPEFLAEINKDTNKKVPIQWSGYIQFKRIAAGDVKNTFEESYNHQIVKSNTVTTHTKAPKPTPTPKPKAPIMPSLSREAPKAVVAAVPAPQPSPQAAPQELPQTGNGSQSGVAALGFAGILLSLGALGTKKKVRA